jgi:exonuclease SbcC
MVEQSVNRHFSYVTWKMSKEDNNGNVSPYCECYVGGIALHDGLNQGARVNASLDIINTLCRYYDAYAPIVTDNSESVNKLIDTKSQQIRLFVSEDENIIIK